MLAQDLPLGRTTHSSNHRAAEKLTRYSGFDVEAVTIYSYDVAGRSRPRVGPPRRELDVLRFGTATVRRARGSPRAVLGSWARIGVC
jgi:hypothetical protein